MILNAALTSINIIGMLLTCMRVIPDYFNAGNPINVAVTSVSGHV